MFNLTSLTTCRCRQGSPVAVSTKENFKLPAQISLKPKKIKKQNMFFDFKYGIKLQIWCRNAKVIALIKRHNFPLS